MTCERTSAPALPVAPGTLVVVSSLLVPAPGVQALEQAFRNRLGAVDDWSGYHGLQVWRDLHSPGRYAMTSWWADKTSFARYMRSRDHGDSHSRAPQGEHAAVLETLHRYEVIAT